MKRMSKGVREEVARIAKFCYYGSYSSAEERLKEHLREKLQSMGLYGKGIYYALKGVIEALKEKNEYSAIYRIVNAPSPKEAAEIKSEYPVAYADAFCIATAVRAKGSVLTGDPEFNTVGGLVRVIWLD